MSYRTRLDVALRAIGACAMFSIAPDSTAQDAEIQWKVINRFPLISDFRFKELDAEWPLASTSRTPMHALVTARMGRRSLPLIAAPSDVSHSYRNGLYKPSYLSPASKDMTLVEVRMLNQVGPCAWEVPQGARLLAASECVATLEVPRTITTQVVARTNSTRATADIQPREILIAAFGDSYGSGEGNPDLPTSYGSKVPVGNDWFARSENIVEGPQWLDPVCHRSLLSWPMLAPLRLALEHPHVIVTVANYACSGAEIVDGFFLAQSNPPGSHALSSTSQRDGQGPRYVGQPGKFVPRSQINALREDLCARLAPNSTPKDLGDAPYVAATRNCDQFTRLPDALLISVGGNDVGFASSVKGLLMPDVARSAIPPLIGVTQGALNLVRRVAGAISIEQLKANIDNLQPQYAALLLEISKDAMVSPAKTVVLAYPDPVGGSPGVCATQPGRLRVKHANLAFAPFARAISPGMVRPFMNWAVEVSPSEVGRFHETAYPALKSMQFGLTSYGFRVADFTAAAPDLFDNRLICTDETDPVRAAAQWSVEPFYFCQGPTAENPRDADRCAEYVGTDPGRNFLNRNLENWNAQAAGRRLVNSVNDALLTQSRKPDSVYSSADLLISAVTGAFHPVAEAQALGADSAYLSLCDAVNTPSSFSGSIRSSRPLGFLCEGSSLRVAR